MAYIINKKRAKGLAEKTDAAWWMLTNLVAELTRYHKFNDDATPITDFQRALDKIAEIEVAAVDQGDLKHHPDYQQPDDNANLDAAEAEAEAAQTCPDCGQPMPDGACWYCENKPGQGGGA